MLEGALLATRNQAVKRGLLSKASFDAGLALSQAMTQLQPAVAAKGPVDPGLQAKAATAAQQLLAALQAETADDRNFHTVPGAMGQTTAALSENRYTAETRLTTTFLFWSSTQTGKSGFEALPGLVRRGRWSEAFRDYRRMLDGLDLWVADQLRKQGKGTPEEALGNAQQHYAQLRTGLEQIADKHAARLPALFHPDSKTVENEKAAGRPAADTIPMNVYFWKDEKDGKFHIHDLTTPSRPHEHTVDGQPTAAMMNTFFEDIARYPEGEVRYTLPDGTAGVAPTSGKTKWYEWVGYAGLAIAAVGLALLTEGASVPATVCFAASALAGGISAAGHLVDTAQLGTATTATVVLDVAQIVASFASFGAMGITVRASSAAAVLGSSRWFVPLVGTGAGADVVQLVALTDITIIELNKIQNGAGRPEDKQRAMAVLLTQLLVVSGLTAFSVQGARSTRALAGQQLEIVEQNGKNVLRVVGDDAPLIGESTTPPKGHMDAAASGALTPDIPSAKPTGPKLSGADSSPAATGDEHWLADLERGLDSAERSKLAKMKAGKTPQQTRSMLGGDLDAARDRVRAEVRADEQRAVVNAKSKERVADLQQQILDLGLMSDPEIRVIVSGTTAENLNKQIPKIRDKLVARILRVEARSVHSNAEVFDNVKIYEKLPEATLQEWRSKNRGKAMNGLIERDDGIYMQRGELDMMVVERQKSGKAKIIVREEIKTGVRDTNAAARAQLDSQSSLFSDAAAGKKTLRLEVGVRDIAGEIDLASDAVATKSTRGPAGKGFDESLGVTAGDLEAMCKDLLANSTAAGRMSP